MEKKDSEASHQAELERLHAAHADAPKHKEASHSADLERLEKLHLEEKVQKGAALKDAQDQLVKDTKAAQALQGKITRLAQERVLFFSIFLTPRPHSCSPELFPGTREAAKANVEASHDERRAAAIELDAAAGWAMEKIATGTKDRMHELAHSLNRLQDVGLAMVKALWPDAVEPASMSRLSCWLEVGSARLDAWQKCAGSEAELAAVEDELQVWASDIASFATCNEFSLERDADGSVAPEDQFQLALHDANGTSNETTFEDADSSNEAYADSIAKGGAEDARAGDITSTSGRAGNAGASASGAVGDARAMGGATTN
ncbi:hypothetical protein ZWY2020_037949 [Hordeum vulgare]|nr:hypothetical protein ZWY2020_037949 [Hordeum vulgare]